MNQNKKGMTLVELIVSIALLSIVMVFLTKLLVSVSANSLSVITRGEYREAATILTRNIQDELLQEEVDFFFQCDTTNTCVEIGFNSGNLLTINISEDKKTIEIKKEDANGTLLSYSKKNTPVQDANGSIGKYDNIEYVANTLETSANYSYEYNALLNIKFNIYDRQDNEYPIEVNYPYNEDNTNITFLSISDAALAAYPVGSIYQSTTLSTVSAVQAILGGTWEAYGSGKVLVGVDTTQTEFDTVEETGGEKTHTLTIAEMPSHNHTFTRPAWYSSEYISGPDIFSYNQGASNAISGNTNNTGGGSAHNNLQPYITVYTYRRTA